ncbi:hypothetical protein GGR56DRAFT_644859 [Xylariaceae sp. FL0804]|nr:hypothetical protein GGR56DRAFT_644859 [Xylariaceae sp. FL0804]
MVMVVLVLVLVGRRARRRSAERRVGLLEAFLLSARGFQLGGLPVQPGVEAVDHALEVSFGPVRLAQLAYSG